MTERTDRLDELLLQEISRIIARDVHDPRVGFVTVTRVEVAPDLRHARVWVSLIGQPDERKAGFRALGRAMPFVRHQLGVLRLKRIPDLHLLLDDSVQRGARVLQILDDLEAGRVPAVSRPGETLPTPGVGPADASDEPQASGEPREPHPPDVAGGAP
jgi:ribosome-binding factor A